MSFPCCMDYPMQKRDKKGIKIGETNEVIS